MAEYAITFSRSARRELEELSAGLITRVWMRIEALAKDCRPPGAKKLVGMNDLWRLQVGDYRVIYSIDDKNTT